MARCELCVHTDDKAEQHISSQPHFGARDEQKWQTPSPKGGIWALLWLLLVMKYYYFIYCYCRYQALLLEFTAEGNARFQLRLVKIVILSPFKHVGPSPSLTFCLLPPSLPGRTAAIIMPHSVMDGDKWRSLVLSEHLASYISSLQPYSSEATSSPSLWLATHLLAFSASMWVTRTSLIQVQFHTISLFPLLDLCFFLSPNIAQLIPPWAIFILYMLKVFYTC